MNYYRITAPFLTVVGQVHLTDAQAAARKTMLDPLPDLPGQYATRQAIGFKKGEILGCSATLDGAEPLRMTEADFQRAVLAERAAAAAAKAAMLKTRAEREARFKALAAQRLKEREAKARALSKNREGK